MSKRMLFAYRAVDTGAVPSLPRPIRSTASFMSAMSRLHKAFVV